MDSDHITIELDRDLYEPGEVLTGRYRLAAGRNDADLVVDIVVYWCSSGKGTEDRGIQHRESRTIPQGATTDESGGEFSIVLPATPMTYNGVLIKLGWCVEVRAGSDRKHQAVAAVPFQLGRVGPVAEVTS